jgi:hypothetical protein
MGAIYRNNLCQEIYQADPTYYPTRPTERIRDSQALIGLYEAWYRLPWRRTPPSWDNVFNGGRDHTTKIPAAHWVSQLSEWRVEKPFTSNMFLRAGRNVGKSVTIHNLLKLHRLGYTAQSDMLDRVTMNIASWTSNHLLMMWRFRLSPKGSVFEEIEKILVKNTTFPRRKVMYFEYFPESDTTKGMRAYHDGHRPSELAFHIGRQAYIVK